MSEDFDSGDVSESTDAGAETEVTESDSGDEGVQETETEVSDESVEETAVETSDEDVEEAEDEISDEDVEETEDETSDEDVEETEDETSDEDVEETEDETSDEDVEETAEETEENGETHPLSESDKEELANETGWSDEVIDSMKSKEEAEIYKNADLKEEEVDGKKCLIRNDLDMEQEDEFGRTNQERMENGNAPISKDGETIELHHIGQKQDSPLAELKTSEHRGKGNDTILHDKQKESEIDRSAFATERTNHWKARS